jgi:hypothetical protein
MIQILTLGAIACLLLVKQAVAVQIERIDHNDSIVSVSVFSGDQIPPLPDELQVAAKRQVLESALTLHRMHAAVESAGVTPAKEIPMRTVKAGNQINDIGSFGGALWGIESDFIDSKYLVEINPKTGAIKKRFNCPGSNKEGNWGIGVGRADLWITNSLDDAIYQVSKTDGRVRKTYKISGLLGVIHGGAIDKNGNYWFGQWDYSGSGSKLLRLDTRAGKVKEMRQIKGTETIYDITFDANGFMFVSASMSSNVDLILKIHPTRFTVLKTYEKNPCEYGLSFVGSQLMMADWFWMKYYLYTLPK